MKDVLPIIGMLLKLITPNEDAQQIRLEKKKLRLEKKKRKLAKKLYNEIKKEFKKDGFTVEETTILNQLRDRIIQRKIELINNNLIFKPN